MESEASGWQPQDDESGLSPASRRAQALVTPLAVASVAIAGLLAALMHTRAEAPRGVAAPAAARTAVQASPLKAGGACFDCGVVEKVVALQGAAGVPGDAYRMRIRMDDGTVRTVEQRGAFAAGSRVVVAGGSVRALPNPAGRG